MWQPAASEIRFHDINGDVLSLVYSPDGSDACQWQLGRHRAAVEYADKQLSAAPLNTTVSVLSLAYSSRWSARSQVAVGNLTVRYIGSLYFLRGLVTALCVYGIQRRGVLRNTLRGTCEGVSVVLRILPMVLMLASGSWDNTVSVCGMRI